MAIVHSITAEKFPKQGNYAGKRVTVRFRMNQSKPTGGAFVRDDCEAPFVKIIQLDDGRFVLSTECRYS